MTKIATADVRFYEELLAHPHLVEHCPVFLGTQIITSGKTVEVSVDAQEHRTGCDVMLCLEDLTARFTKPCVCDVKLGNIQHGHDAPPHKATRSLVKCRKSTSLKLGFRLCGMKVWKPHLEEYITVDKYAGRRVRPERIDAAVGMFFDDGISLRREVIGMLQEKVSALIETMRYHDAHRFYSASVLLIYEGDPRAPLRCDVRLIDFAHTVRVTEVPSQQGRRRGPDNGLLLGLLRLHESMERLQEKRSVPCETPSTTTDTGTDGPTTSPATTDNEYDDDTTDHEKSDAVPVTDDFDQVVDGGRYSEVWAEHSSHPSGLPRQPRRASRSEKKPRKGRARQAKPKGEAVCMHSSSTEYSWSESSGPEPGPPGPDESADLR